MSETEKVRKARISHAKFLRDKEVADSVSKSMQIIAKNSPLIVAHLRKLKVIK